MNEAIVTRIASFGRGEANLDFDMLQLHIAKKFMELYQCSNPVVYFWICLKLAKFGAGISNIRRLETYQVNLYFDE